ncbi:MAG: lysophospholipid acyltransferase family protein [Anaerolineales bacterium]|nr:1-acyl-sn-glycerol-3-phosphate acyltransferase [Anaerolineales bacterium]MCS7247190.1 1-acyl-sn-glycerol-3-phosphate acyltransferase [Anaerolineales bacterium]MDW8161001.1 lysophospholipid acyltransferase family protein [Anaerolineales bacterium]MDW8447230.1 lysophospholipid acyltransferase family protein [Anaerolineales bacterium]
MIPQVIALPLARFLNFVIKQISAVLLDLEADELRKVPPKGPLILAANHINFIEVPVVYTHLQPRPITGLAKAEIWNTPLMALLFNLWGGIPVRRGEADILAVKRCLQALREEKIVAIAPEGTRSGDGRLRKGHSGIVWLAMKSKAPILPLAFYGAENYWRKLRNLRKIPFRVRVGEPFIIEPPSEPLNQRLRAQITDEIMVRIAALLPPAYRGIYAHRVNERPRYLKPFTFDPPADPISA